MTAHVLPFMPDVFLVILLMACTGAAILYLGSARFIMGPPAERDSQVARHVRTLRRPYDWELEEVWDELLLDTVPGTMEDA